MKKNTKLKRTISTTNHKYLQHLFCISWQSKSIDKLSTTGTWYNLVTDGGTYPNHGFGVLKLLWRNRVKVGKLNKIFLHFLSNFWHFCWFSCWCWRSETLKKHQICKTIGKKNEENPCSTCLKHIFWLIPVSTRKSDLGGTRSFTNWYNTQGTTSYTYMGIIYIKNC